MARRPLRLLPIRSVPSALPVRSLVSAPPARAGADEDEDDVVGPTGGGYVGYIAGWKVEVHLSKHRSLDRPILRNHAVDHPDSRSGGISSRQRQPGRNLRRPVRHRQGQVQHPENVIGRLRRILLLPNDSAPCDHPPGVLHPRGELPVPVPFGMRFARGRVGRLLRRFRSVLLRRRAYRVGGYLLRDLVPIVHRGADGATHRGLRGEEGRLLQCRGRWRLGGRRGLRRRRDGSGGRGECAGCIIFDSDYYWP
mmetsp:Transcript_36848/g.88880  ORF Transcript_36848/g.88880 Transcript_36848/m.88880 type:complete len:252 (+) Transcript_36848:503-1258(+)